MLRASARHHVCALTFKAARALASAGLQGFLEARSDMRAPQGAMHRQYFQAGSEELAAGSGHLCMQWTHRTLTHCQLMSLSPDLRAINVRVPQGAMHSVQQQQGKQKNTHDIPDIVSDMHKMTATEPMPHTPAASQQHSIESRTNPKPWHQQLGHSERLLRLHWQFHSPTSPPARCSHVLLCDFCAGTHRIQAHQQPEQTPFP